MIVSGLRLEANVRELAQYVEQLMDIVSGNQELIDRLIMIIEKSDR